MENLKCRIVSRTNAEKLKIIQKDLEEGYAYSEIITSTIDRHGYPIGQLINGWRTGGVGITEEDRKILQSM